jgi:hypothetical protein
MKQRALLIRLLTIWPVIASASESAREIPRTWDDAEMAKHEIPRADPAGSPKYVSSDYYYKIPVRPIYRGYPVYAPGHEPPGYMDWLKRQEPVIVWDDRSHAPPLKTEADWIRAGRIVYYATTRAQQDFRIEDFRNPDFYQKTGTPVAKHGTVPAVEYVIHSKGVVELGFNSCASCHTRVMPDGSLLDGAQSNFPVQRAFAYGFRAAAAAAEDQDQFLKQQRAGFKGLHATPWLHPDPEDRIDAMSIGEIALAYEAIPPGVSLRAGTNLFTPVQVPDLIGVKERRYFDRTGLEIHRSIGDFMRYSALNQGANRLASYAGFVPADMPRYTQLPNPEASRRYSDEQLYALALYVYSLQAPPNPNRFDSLAARGQKIFEKENCGMCHTPPLYTNNKLTPARGFQIPPEHLKTYDILQIAVGTDSNLALRTRRGTGYYKVPSLKGLWYREMFSHDGSCATLEDWFDARRLGDDYVPTGFKGFGVQKRKVPGHEFGLSLSPDDKKALITFLRTL